MAASPDWQTGPAPPRRCAPTALASRHNYGDLHFATDARRLGGGGADGRATRDEFAVAVADELERIVKRLNAANSSDK
jgi:hypothetical protein